MSNPKISCRRILDSKGKYTKIYEWRKDNGELHNDQERPARFAYDVASGRIEWEEWWRDGVQYFPKKNKI